MICVDEGIIVNLEMNNKLEDWIHFISSKIEVQPILDGNKYMVAKGRKTKSNDVPWKMVNWKSIEW